MPEWYRLGKRLLNAKYAKTIAKELSSGVKNTKLVSEPIKSIGPVVNGGNMLAPQELAKTYHLTGLTLPESESISIAEKLGIPKGERNQFVKPNPKAGAHTEVNTYLINRSKQPWTSDGENVIFKIGEPITTAEGGVRSPLSVHFTTDLSVMPHNGGDPWALADDTFLIPYKSVVENNGLPSNIHPMDTWFTGNSTFKMPIKGMKVLTGNPKNYRQYKAQGFDVEYSPESHKAILAEDRWGNREIVDNWIRKTQEANGMRPTMDTYLQMEKETGLPSGVDPDGIWRISRPQLFPIYRKEPITYYHAPIDHSISWSFNSMQNLPIKLQDAAGLAGILNVRNFRNPRLRHYRDQVTRGRITERELPALQKVVQTQKDFTARVPKYEPINPKKDIYPWNNYIKELTDLEKQYKKHEPDSILDTIFSGPDSDWLSKFLNLTPVETPEMILTKAIESGKLPAAVPIRRINYGTNQSTVDKIDRILKGEILYKKQGGILKGQKGLSKVSKLIPRISKEVPIRGFASKLKFEKIPNGSMMHFNGTGFDMSPEWDGISYLTEAHVGPSGILKNSTDYQILDGVRTWKSPSTFTYTPIVKDTDYYKWMLSRQSDQVLNGTSGMAGLSRVQFNKLQPQVQWDWVERFFNTHTRSDGEPWLLKQGGNIKSLFKYE